jgi:hypothetical protein
MIANDAEAKARVAAEILEYLRDHPRAGDTLEGIVEWWLPRQRYEHSVLRIQRALDDLVATGRVAKTGLPDGTAFYAACST